MNNSVLEVTNKNGNALGTGFVVALDDNGGFIATCGHVVKSCGDDILVNNKPASIVCNKYDEGLDLAILYVGGIKLKPFKLAYAGNTNVKVVGYSKLIGNNKKEVISNISVKKDVEINNIKSIKLYPHENICEGYSGSPVLCEMTNNVVGVVNIKSGQDNYAISSEHLADLVGVSIVSACKYSKIKLKTNLNDVERGIVKSKLQDNFNKALASFSSQKSIWVPPHLDRSPEEKPAETSKVDISSLTSSPNSVLIRSRQQYGATSLAHFLIKEAWDNENPSFWLYLDANQLKPYKKEIKKETDKILKNYGLTFEDIECVVLDEFSSSIKNGNKLLSEASEFFDNKPIVLMYSADDNPLVDEEVNLPRDFIVLNLWSLDRKGVRTLVNYYNSEDAIEEETRVLNKVVNDLEALNIPRTPQNCLTILKISEREFDDSPVNRAEMISRVLHLLFNVDDIPHYKTRPDLKDTEFTLGYFCEQIIRSRVIYFSRDYFVKDLTDFCYDNEIDLEVHIIFDILFRNNIIVGRNGSFCFKFTYWVYYFAAHRMLHDQAFTDYILNDFNYVNYPELIEFYTGIDRRRNDALNIIADDLNTVERIVDGKCNLPEELNIYGLTKWLPSERSLELLEKEVSNSVASSSLPDEIKDEYADRSYNRTTPLVQNIHTILEEYSLLRLMEGIKAGSLALRNSDFVDKDIKHKLLDSVLQGIKQLTNVLVALSPVLAKNDYADIEGASFVLHGNFSDKFDQKLNQIICCVPSNMIDWYVDKLFTQKMGTLVNNKLLQEEDSFKKHYMHLMLIAKRPKKWEESIAEYVLSVDKNSFYLLDIVTSLKAEYKYSYTSSNNLKKMGDLIKLCVGKHNQSLLKPSMKKAQRLPDRMLPERLV